MKQTSSIRQHMHQLQWDKIHTRLRWTTYLKISLYLKTFFIIRNNSIQTNRRNCSLIQCTPVQTNKYTVNI